MMGEELNSSVVTERGLLGDRQFCRGGSGDREGGGAKNPRTWGHFFDFRAAYAQPPQTGSAMPPVRITLPDGAIVTSERGDLEQVPSHEFGRDVAFAQARAGEAASGATAEEYCRTWRVWIMETR
jgi:hypothetical protein